MTTVCFIEIKLLMQIFFLFFFFNENTYLLSFARCDQMMSAIKSGHVAYSRFARMAELEEEKHEIEKLKKKITVDRSGGGL